MHESENGEGEEDQWLTASAGKRTASSGENRSGRGGDGDLGGPRLKKTAWSAFEDIRQGVAR